MRLSWLCEQDASWIMLILAIAMILAAELGYRAGILRANQGPMIQLKLFVDRDSEANR
jgi:hypothetical protein